MEQKNLIAEGKDVVSTRSPFDRPQLELPSRITLPEKIFLTRKFNPTFCTCGQHCLHEPQYHMERTVFRLDQLSGPTSAGDLEACIKEKLKTANYIIESTTVEGGDEAELFHSKKIEFIRDLVARLRDEDVYRLQDYFGKEGRITLTGFDGVLLCRERKMPSKAKSVKQMKKKAVVREGVSTEVTTQTYQAKKTTKERIWQTEQKTDRKQKDIVRNIESKSAQPLDKPDFNKDMADIVQAYEAEYKECKENDKESVAKRVDVTDAFDGDFAPEINFVLEKIKSQPTVDERKVGYVPYLSTAVRDDIVVAPDISKSKNKDPADISGLSSESIVMPYVTCDFSHQMKGIVQAYEAQYAKAEEFHDQTTDNVIDPFKTNQDDFEPEPDYSFFEKGDNTGVPELGQSDFSCPLYDGRQEAEAYSFTEAQDVTERITVVKEPTTFHSENDIYAEIADIVRVYEAEVDESENVDKRKLSDTLSTVHSCEDDGEFEETLKQAFFISAIKPATSVAKETAVDIDCSVNRLNEATKTPEASDSAEYTEDFLDKVNEIEDRNIVDVNQAVGNARNRNVVLISIYNCAEQTEGNTGAPIGPISDLTMTVFKKAEAKDIERYDEECQLAPEDIEREELKAVDSQEVVNISDTSEISIERASSSTSEIQEAEALGVLPQLDSQAAADNSNDELVSDTSEISIERASSDTSEMQEADALGVLPQLDSESAEENSGDELIEDSRHSTQEVVLSASPVIACYDDEDDNGLSPCFGILAVYCESEIHASWGGTNQGLVETV